MQSDLAITGDTQAGGDLTVEGTTNLDASSILGTDNDSLLKVQNNSTQSGSKAIWADGKIALALGGVLQANKNDIVVDDENDLSTGSGMKYNSTGHGNGPSIDFYLGGTVKGYFDADGWKTT